MSLFIYLFLLFAPRDFSPLLKNQNFQIPVWAGIWSTLTFQGFCPTGMGRTEPWEQSWNMVEEPLFEGAKFQIINLYAFKETWG